MDDPFICPQCGNEYNTRSILIRHLSSHAEKQFKCHLCQKKNSQKDHLKRHTDSIHYQLKKWECNRCDAKFSRKEHLMNHKQTIHEEEQIFKRSERKGEKKKYPCRYCEKSFDLAHVKKHHEKIHTGEKPFKCKVCGHNFRQKNQLNTHIHHKHDDSVGDAAKSIKLKMKPCEITLKPVKIKMKAFEITLTPINIEMKSFDIKVRRIHTTTKQMVEVENNKSFEEKMIEEGEKVDDEEELWGNEYEGLDLGIDFKMEKFVKLTW